MSLVTRWRIAGRCLPIALLSSATCTVSYDSGPSPAPLEARGSWLGTLTYAGGAESPTRMIVTPTGAAYLLPLTEQLTPLPYEHQGTLYSTNHLVSGNLWRSISGGILSVDVAGDVVPHATLDFALSGTGILDGALVQLGFDSSYERGSSFDRVSGNWFLGDLSLSIQSDGSIQGSDLDGGVYVGQIHVPWPSVNVYTVDLEAGFAGMGFPYQFQGVATLLDGASTSSVLLVTMIGYGSLFSPTLYWSPQLER